MRYVQTYFVRGAVLDSYKVRLPYALKDPPVAGNSTAFILGEGKRLTLFHPFTLQAYSVTDKAMEVTLAKDLTYDPKRLADMITVKWKDYKLLQMQRDYGVAAAVLIELGAEVPEDIPIMQKDDKKKPPKKGGGKLFEASRFKVLKVIGKRADVATFFLKPASVLAAMAKLSMTRSGVLSHLFCIWRDHGIGYEVQGDTAKLLYGGLANIFAEGITVKVVDEEEDFLQ